MSNWQLERTVWSLQKRSRARNTNLKLVSIMTAFLPMRLDDIIKGVETEKMGSGVEPRCTSLLRSQRVYEEPTQSKSSQQARRKTQECGVWPSEEASVMSTVEPNGMWTVRLNNAEIGDLDEKHFVKNGTKAQLGEALERVRGVELMAKYR